MYIFICRVYFALCVLVVRNRAISRRESYLRKVGIETLDPPLFRYMFLKLQNITITFVITLVSTRVIVYIMPNSLNIIQEITHFKYY